MPIRRLDAVLAALAALEADEEYQFLARDSTGLYADVIKTFSDEIAFLEARCKEYEPQLSTIMDIQLRLDRLRLLATGRLGSLAMPVQHVIDAFNASRR